MEYKFKVIFKFSLSRILKSKAFIVVTSIFFLILSLMMIIAMKNSDNILKKTEAWMIVIILFSMFWLSFVNINSIVKISISDLRNGIQGLENRRGVKDSTIFFAKFLPLKIVTSTFIFCVFLIFTFFTLVFPVSMQGFIIRNLAVGVFSLFTFDLIIFGLTIWISSATRSMKKSISFCWMVMIFFMLFPILGPGGFFLSMDKEIENQYNPYLKYQQSLRNTQNQDDNFLTELSKSAADLKTVLESNITREGRYKDDAPDSDYLIKLFLDRGMLTFFGDLIEKEVFSESINFYLQNFGWTLESLRIKVDEESIKKELQDNLFYQFTKSVNIKSKGNKEKHWKNSYFYKNSSSNYNKSQQLNEVINNLDNLKNNGFEISAKETKALKKSIRNIYQSEFSPYSNKLVIETRSNTRPLKYDFFSNYHIWIQYSNYSPGSYLFNMINYSLIKDLKPLSYFDQSLSLKVNGRANFLLNPFMWYYETIYFSGNNNIDTNSLISKNLAMSINEFNYYTYKSNGDLKFGKRPFSTTASYILLFSFGALFSYLGYWAFIRPNDLKKNSE
ncbi:ABC transporter permease [Spiroplasma alleghenense]|uniref:ABC transporter permease n=1 Tax=Spiroplasma alleghenense TaxID=216931 RepID=A0A345Z4L2_9MOLU|nr:hypothetical protein [Spiroplasma alleghenense]AXK51541.1 hypothetical protein SALLE_v1c08710 [Spiroplasma alleghenense]